MSQNEISKQMLDAAFLFHSNLDPELFESPYEILLAYELRITNGQLEEEQLPNITLPSPL